MSGGASNGIPTGFGRITRDETGQIVAVETDDDIDSSRSRALVEEAATAAIMLSSECQSWISLGHVANTEDPKIGIIRGKCGRSDSFWK